MDASVAIHLLRCMVDEDFNEPLSGGEGFQQQRRQQAQEDDSTDVSSDDDDHGSESSDSSVRPLTLTAIRLSRLRGFRTRDDRVFVQLVQLLFTDHVSRVLKRLELSGTRPALSYVDACTQRHSTARFLDLDLEDVHFRHLARLLYDGRFPALQELSLSHNAFSSRFMRDWAKSFRQERFLPLNAIDITGS
ncbi:hypothetical protein PINS_up000554 [Pythium insidiosum]|nr:hypothetical protein PINS_up000554 [Pythium insidiosum]